MGTTPRLLSPLRSFLAIAKAGVGASTLSIALGGLPSAALAADEPVTSVQPGPAQDRAPNLIFGGGLGYASHWGRTVTVDAVSGASTPSNKFHKQGLAMNTFVDASVVEIGRGNLGVSASFTIAMPKTFMNVALVPRYRLRFPLAGAAIRSIEPFAGLGVAFAFRDNIDKDVYVTVPISAGCDFQLGSDGVYGGVGLDLNLANPKGVKHGSSEDHLDNAVVLLRVGYRVF